MAKKNLLPLLLVGGAAVYFMSQKKASCPPEINITVEKMQSAAEKAVDESDDVVRQTELYLRYLLPAGCNKNSKKSKVKIKHGEESATLPVPDVYMLVLAGAIGKSLMAGDMTEQEVLRLNESELSWYEELCGKPFNTEAADAFTAMIVKVAEASAEKIQDEADKKKGNGQAGGGTKSITPSNPARTTPPGVIEVDLSPRTATFLGAEFKAKAAQTDAAGLSSLIDEVLSKLNPQLDKYDSINPVRIFVPIPGNEPTVIDTNAMEIANNLALMWSIVNEELKKGRDLTEEEFILQKNTTARAYAQMSGGKEFRIVL